MILVREASRLTEKFFDSDLDAVMEKEFSLLDDFMLNDIIEAALFSGEIDNYFKSSLTGVKTSKILQLVIALPE